MVIDGGTFLHFGRFERFLDGVVFYELLEGGVVEILLRRLHCRVVLLHHHHQNHHHHHYHRVFTYRSPFLLRFEGIFLTVFAVVHFLEKLVRELASVQQIIRERPTFE